MTWCVNSVGIPGRCRNVLNYIPLISSFSQEKGGSYILTKGKVVLLPPLNESGTSELSQVVYDSQWNEDMKKMVEKSLT